MERKADHYEASIYRGELTGPCLVECIAKLRAAFPALTDDFHSVFGSRIKELGFGDKRLKDSINHVIDNCIYPTPTVAQFLTFDKRVKLYTYDQMVKLNNELNGLAFKIYNAVHVGTADKPMWASVQDIQNYNLRIWKKKNN